MRAGGPWCRPTTGGERWRGKRHGRLVPDARGPPRREPYTGSLLGSVATKKLLGVNSAQEVRGRVIEHNNRKYLAGYHPAASFYREDMVENIRQDFALLRQELQKLVLRPEAC